MNCVGDYLGDIVDFLGRELKAIMKAPISE
jgi:hypothetical protein